MKFFALPIALVASVLLPALVSAQTSFSEATLGDFSGDSNAPTSLGELNVGSSTITGSTGAGDRDLVTFSIGANEQLTSFQITDFSGAGGHFFGLAVGDTAPAGGSGFLFAGLVTDPTSPLEILGGGGGSFGGAGVPAVLGPGDYTAFFNETASVLPNYTAQLTVVSSVPEPSAAVLLLASGGMAFLRRRR